MPIARFVLRRLAFGLLTLLVVSVLVFLLTQALGDPAAAVLGRDARQPELLAARRAELGLDRPLVAQYVDWLGGVLRGDLGESYRNGRPVGADLAGRVQNSLFLMGLAATIALPVSLAVGVRAADRRDRVFDRATNGLTLVLAAIPEFVVATGLVIVFSVGVFEVLPAVSSVRGATRPWDDLDGIVLPTVTLALVAVPYVVRATRAALVEVLDTEHIEAATLSGLRHRTVLWRRAVPNALAPVIQVVALSLVYMAGGAVVVEQAFNYPGVGAELVDAVAAHDVPAVQAIALFVAMLYVVVNLVADVAVVLVTPRLRTALP